tara:strand:- start:2097 stop:2327 length:231 start_codon:yes stop_codon:yes gene_type:complete
MRISGMKLIDEKDVPIGRRTYEWATILANIPEGQAWVVEGIPVSTIGAYLKRRNLLDKFEIVQRKSQGYLIHKEIK